MRVTSWLGIGAMTLGVGAVFAGGVAHADSGDNDGPSTGMSASKGGAQGHSKRTAAGGPTRLAPTAPKPGAVSNAGARTVKDQEPSLATGSEIPVAAPSAAASVTRVFGTPPIDLAPHPAAVVPSSSGPVTSVGASSVGSSSAGTTSSTGSCAQCWGVGAPTIAQGLTTAVNHLFNSAFSILGESPTNAISAFLEGALVLVRRTLFFIPTGVTASQVGTELTIGVNTGSVAYFRQSGSDIQLADNPLFWGATNFAATSVSDVSVGNSGNAGCAGFIFTEGTLTGNLTTAGIDSINFGETAAATGTVQAAVTSGPLSLKNAIRGYGGVTIDAAVTLASDVEVDAANANVLFSGTVDAERAGKQSLLVTALGTTTFAGAVGSQAALSSLTTQGIAPLNIVQSNDTTSVPLYYMPNYDTKGKVQVKYGIEVAIGDNAPRYYVFDTGGQGFFAGYNPQYWQGVTLGTNTTSNTYTSGNFFDGVATTTSVTIGSGTQSVTTQPIQIAAITSGGNSKKGTTFDFTNPDATPVDDRFVGDFGASWGVQPVDNQQQGLSSVLFQLPGNLSSGFIVQLGPVGSQQQLTMGITDALRDQFTYAIPVSVATGQNAGFYPVSGYPFLDQFGFTGQYQVQDPASGQPIPLGNTTYPGCAAACLATIIDSGAPSTGVRLPNDGPPFPLATTDTNPSELKPGMDFTAVYPTTQGRPALTWSFLSGTNSSVDAVGYTNESGAAFPGQNVNTGLNLYNQFDVMFDTQLQVIWLRPNGGQATVSLGSVTTTGAQSYGQNAILNGAYTTAGAAFTVAGTTTLTGSSTVVDTNAGAVTFGGTVDGTTAGLQSLAVNSSGATTFVREVGGLIRLANIATDAGGSTSSAGVLTTGGQTYADALSISGRYEGSTFTAAQAAVLQAPTAITVSDGGSVTFGSTVDSVTRQVPTDSGSTEVDLGYALTVSANAGTVNFAGAVGGSSPLGGLTVDAGTTVTAAGSVNLDGTLVTSEKKGLVVEDGATINFGYGGLITGFEDSGVEFKGASQDSLIQGFQITSNGKAGILLADGAAGVAQNYSGTVIAGNQIFGNAGAGIDAAAPILGLTVRGNMIGLDGKPNETGIQFKAGEYNGTTVSQNTISGNAGDGVSLSGGAQALLVINNTIEKNGKDGIALTDGDFTSTLISSNTVSSNKEDGISIGDKTADKAGDNATLTGNTISANGDDGLKINGSNTVITSNTISGNKGDGVDIRRSSSTGNQILSNSIFSNTEKGIALTDGANGDQPAPKIKSVVPQAGGTQAQITAKVDEVEGYSGKFEVQIFGSTASTADKAQGQFLIATIKVEAGEFTETVDITSADQWITMTATPETGTRNTSKFSDAVAVTA